MEVNEHTLARVLEHPDLMTALGQIEDFRTLANDAQKVVTSTKLLKAAKREQGGNLTPEQSSEQAEALKHVIESLDIDLFERVTGLTVADFRLLNRIGLFNAQNMNHAIYQFRSFERASLRYANDDREEGGEHQTVGRWDRSVDTHESPGIGAGALP